MEVKSPVTLNRHLNYSTPAYKQQKTKKDVQVKDKSPQITEFILLWDNCDKKEGKKLAYNWFNFDRIQMWDLICRNSNSHWCRTS